MPSQALPTIQSGQVWRARWDDVLTFVFIDSVLCEFANRVRVAPITLGDEDADDTALILSASASELGVPISVWPQMVTEISEIVLERWVSAINDFDSLESLQHAADGGEIVRGLPILNDMSPRWEERRLLELAMEVLASAATIVRGSGMLSSLLTDIPPSELAATLAVTPALARNIKRARTLVGTGQAEALAKLLNLSADAILHANPNPPETLVELASRRERGPGVRALAKARGETDSDAFLELVQGAWALAARGDRTAAEDWNGRLDTYLEVALAK
jgi:hypothetical protein